MADALSGKLVRNRGLQPILEEDWIGYLNLENCRAFALADAVVHSTTEAEMTLKIYWPEEMGRGETECVLALNLTKRGAEDPDLQGAVDIGGQHYRVGAWINMPPEERKGFTLRLTPTTRAPCSKHVKTMGKFRSSRTQPPC